MFAYLKSLPPVARKRTGRTRCAFRSTSRRRSPSGARSSFVRRASQADPRAAAAWNRGAYLVETLGHCNACHSRRNVFGATAGPLDLAGGLIPIQNWYAPSLTRQRRSRRRRLAGARGRRAAQARGVSARGSVQGPMAEVVARSTQLPERRRPRGDGRRTWQRCRPEGRPRRRRDRRPPRPCRARRGAKLYATHCAACHGEHGEGVAGRLSGARRQPRRDVTPPANLVHMVLRGGYLPTTAGNPRPFGMPPFATVLSDAEVAEVLSFLRALVGAPRRRGLDARGQPLPRRASR